MKETLSVKEAAVKFYCSPQAIRRAIKAGDIVAYRPGKAVRVDVESAEKWFVKNKV